MIRFEHLIDRAAHYQPCPRCSRHTITALSGGVPLRLDPEPLTINQEIAALLSGRQTYDVMLWGLPRRMHPIWRDISRIRAPRKHAVIAAHKCTPLPVPPGRQPETELTVPYPSTVTETPLF
jgi:hypothetical protein